MGDDGEDRTCVWLQGWLGMQAPAGELASALSTAHHQVRALETAVRVLKLDDGPTRIQAVLARRARR